VSTKIHHGYRIDDRLLDERSFVAAARGVFGPAYEADYLTVAVELASFVADCRAIDPARDLDIGAAAIGAGDPIAASNPLPPLLIADQVMARMQRAIAESGHRNPTFDFGCEIVLLRDLAGDGALYALLYTERRSYTRQWESLRAVTPHPYWNTTDRPDDVTDDEWEQRRCTWNRLLPGYDPPSIRGLTWSLLGDGHTTSAQAVAGEDPARIEAAIPDLHRRVAAIRRAGLEVTGEQLRALTAADLLSTGSAT
jgi:hypothetical protein